MTEEFLHFIWKIKAFDACGLHTLETNERVEILSPGSQNTDAGPDFSSARIRLGNQLWVGNVEIHVHIRDWFIHKHHLDASYSNVIVHVIHEDNPDSKWINRTNIPTINLFGRIDLAKFKLWKTWKSGIPFIPCEKLVGTVPESVIRQTIVRSSIHRLERKSKELQQRLVQQKGDWERILLKSIARSMGQRVNQTPFEILADRIPLNLIRKLVSDQHSIEAIIFGLAGFLEEEVTDDYSKGLKDRFAYLKRVYQWKSMAVHQWKFLRMRPAGFPTIRMAQWASILSLWHELAHFCFYEWDWNATRKIMMQPTSEYWSTHYRFGKTAPKRIKKMGKQQVDLILINAILPVRFAFAKAMDNPLEIDRIFAFFQTIDPENNRIIRAWKTRGVRAYNAMESQGLIELFNEFCTSKKCLTCPTGTWILNRT
jgi:hypothetical protein